MKASRVKTLTECYKLIRQHRCLRGAESEAWLLVSGVQRGRAAKRRPTGVNYRTTPLSSSSAV